MASQVEKLLGRRVAAYRETAGLTQERLASKVRVAVETISRLERGTSIPSVVRLERIAKALGIELRDLFDFPGRPSARDEALDALVRDLKRHDRETIEFVHDIGRRVLLFAGRDKT